MASPVEICNLALSRLGEAAHVSSIDPPEGSTQAYLCAAFFAQTRDRFLEHHAWGFATTRDRLALKAKDQPGEWSMSYALPNHFIRCLEVYCVQGVMDVRQEYAIEGNIVMTNAEGAFMLFIRREEDTTKYPPAAIDALAWLLASELAGAIYKGGTGAEHAKRCLQAYQLALSIAAASDANQGHQKITDEAPWIRARR
ncbi:MAG: hypothetical protein LBE22_10360 [Azoarcus sp.]|jgi:hypothetical protein|nr:hypothetical protein [Azoarcus sp.]